MGIEIKNESIINPEALSLSFGGQPTSDEILSGDDIEALIMSQLSNTGSIPAPVSYTQEPKHNELNSQEIKNEHPTQVIPPVYIKTEIPKENPQPDDKYNIKVEDLEEWGPDELEEQKSKSKKNSNDSKDSESENKTNPDKKVTLNEIDPTFNLEELYTDFNKLKEGFYKRIQDLENKQKLLDSRVKTLEKFIKLDEADLATQYINQTKDKTNTGYIKQLTGSILNKTELLTMTMDISLKHENLILSWNKELFNIEKEKVSSYVKIRNLNKSTEETDNSINDILSKINESVKTNKGDLISAAQNELSISGYAGKPFGS